MLSSPHAIPCAVVVAIAALVATPVAHAERLSDKDIRALLERVDHDRDRFEDQLDGKLKRSIIRGPGGEVHVERDLDKISQAFNIARPQS